MSKNYFQDKWVKDQFNRTAEKECEQAEATKKRLEDEAAGKAPENKEEAAGGRGGKEPPEHRKP